MPSVLGNSHPHNTIHLQTLRSWQTYKQAQNPIIYFYIQMDKLTFAILETIFMRFWTLFHWYTENIDVSGRIRICQERLIRCVCYKDLKIAELWFWIRANVCPVGQRGRAGMPGVGLPHPAWGLCIIMRSAAGLLSGPPLLIWFKLLTLMPFLRFDIDWSN